MRNCKLSITIALLCSFMANPAKAFFPVFDFAEIPAGVVQQIVVAVENLAEMKDQISEMTQTLKAVGDVKETIANFGDSFYGDLTEQFAEATEKAIDKAYTTNLSVQDKVIVVAESVNNTHKSIINTMVSQIENKMEIAQVKEPEYMKLALNEQRDLYIEENEEEAIDVNQEKENLQKYFASVKKESSQLYGKMNDLFDSSINVMNESADLSHQALAALEQKIDDSKELVSEEKKELQERTVELLNKNQENSDVIISLMEDVQNNYGKQYQEKIADNINNYQKMAQAYIEGNITAEELRAAGGNLREQADSLSIFDNSEIFNAYNEKSTDIKVSTEELVKDIKQLRKDKEENS